ncbi:CRISPR-associated endoribonuclease Cas6 [Synechococcales cyanobacterium C]|uniref:CRISPR-associated endoribonuclease Cas6 n=1 Tax=Petrachloros mirabilis ULC683 TaxID=2781853 RepID=A0A8K1ZZD7_9CYAN|nr:CRISPR-associated endoribonuclease Cas6 [Petrachloros mirabilis]NCJ06632.1 CRISPR-associated endoribonuclease Cas6 [Petrachloros mirabilis ULC683]
MPYSLVLNLIPTSPIPPGFTTGKHLHALFLNLISTVDAELGNQLHANEGNKAFTLSPLQRGVVKRKDCQPIHWNHFTSIPAHTPCWWRISLLDDALFSHLTQLWLNLNPEHPWHLGPANLYISSILGTPQSTQPWANYCNYAQLYGQASEHERKLTLQFYTPTAFRQGKYDCALPTPDRVFGSLLRRWNHYSNLQFSSDILKAVQPSYFNIRTEVASDPRHQFQHTGAKISLSNQFMGCVGRVTYQILGSVESDVIKQLNALANFGLYAGVGRKTPMGMGMCRRV